MGLGLLHPVESAARVAVGLHLTNELRPLPNLFPLNSALTRGSALPANPGEVIILILTMDSYVRIVEMGSGAISGVRDISIYIF